jgi:hypothetical protein
MRRIARLNASGFQILMIVAVALPLLLAACNNGSNPGY